VHVADQHGGGRRATAPRNGLTGRKRRVRLPSGAVVSASALPHPASITLRRRIEWIDTDAAGIYHWTTVFRLAEAAEAALHTALGVADVTFGRAPRVSVAVDFQRALRYNERVDVVLTVAELGRSSVRYDLLISGEQGSAVTGQLTAVFVDRETWRSAPWPDDIRERLAAGGPQQPAD
jgi:acyl-CoA thioesterase FadM